MRSLASVSIVFGLALGAISSAAAENLSDLILKVRAARVAGDKATWLTEGRKMLTFADEHPDLLFSVARAEAANGNSDAALKLLSDAVRRGGGFDLDATVEFKTLASNAAFKAIAADNARNRTPLARAALFAEIHSPDVLPEGITYDARRKRFIVGSMRGALWQVTMSGVASPFVQPTDRTELREVLGVKVDVVRDIVWCATGVFPDIPPPATPKPDAGTTGLNAYDLDSGVVRAKIKLDERPRMHGFNDLAVMRNGDVYVTDTADQSIYRVRQGKEDLELFYRADTLTFPNGIVLSPDEKTIYVGHVEGVTAIDVKSKAARKLAIGPDMAVGSIDGLAQKSGALIGVQNSPYLMRVIRMTLSGDQRSVAKVEVLASHGLLTRGALTGVVVEDGFYVVASQLPGPSSGTPPPNPVILRVPLK